MEILKEYHNLYWRPDILLLADFFEIFRKIFLDFYELDPCHNCSAPTLSWDASSKLSGIRLEVINNKEMSTFVEKAIRGWISQISPHNAVANTLETGWRYNPEQPLFISVMLTLTAYMEKLRLIHCQQVDLSGWRKNRSVNWTFRS